MPDPIPLKRPINWDRLRADEAERIIREWSQDSAKVIIHEDAHAQVRSEERDIPDPDVRRILRAGFVQDQPVKNKHGDWEAVIRKRQRGSRDAGVATIIIRRNETLVVKTIMWMDL